MIAAVSVFVLLKINNSNVSNDVVIDKLSQANEPLAKSPSVKAPPSVEDRRKSFGNLVYEGWQKRGIPNPNGADSIADDDTDLSLKCSAYFDELSNLQPIDLDKISRFDFDKLLYHQSNWFKKAKKNLQKELRRTGLSYTLEHDEKVWKSFTSHAQSLLDYEALIVQDFNHKKVFGKCFLHSALDLKKHQLDSVCEDFERRLFPWLSKSSPKIEKLDGDTIDLYSVASSSQEAPDNSIPCVLAKVNQISTGQGVVIPVLPTDKKEKQINSIERLIKVLRALKNKFPIQITYSNDMLTENDKKKLFNAAQMQVSEVPKPYIEYLSSIGESIEKIDVKKHFPPQDLSFVNMSPMINREMIPKSASLALDSANFVMSLSMIFNSFQEVIMMTSHTIPLIENIGGHLFDHYNYKNSGHLLFKTPARFNFERKPNTPGFQEVNDLIKDQLLPSDLDGKYFNLYNRAFSSVSNKILYDKIRDILDPNLMIVNKSKNLGGFLMSADMLLYEIFNTRFAGTQYELKSDFLWLGLQISGVTSKLAFNNKYGVAAGVLTPHQKRPFSMLTTSHELCSSSWGQIDDENEFDLLYVTNHQLENWISDPLFKKNLVEKYTVTKDKKGNDPDNIDLLSQTISKNPLYIQSNLRPPVLYSKVYDPDYKEPKLGWIQKKGFISYQSHPYWCAYDVVGSPYSSNLGYIEEYNPTLQAKYYSLLDVWLNMH